MGTLDTDHSTRDNHHNARQYARGNVTIIADIRARGRARNKNRVVDLSQTGFRMHCLDDYPVDSVVFLTIPGFAPLESRIAWRTEWTYGCEFVQPLYAAIYEHILNTYPAYELRTAHNNH